MTRTAHDHRSIARGSRSVGTWLKLMATEPCEIIADAGFDFVVIDLEHAPISTETTYRIIAQCAALGVQPFVRVGDHGPSLIQKVLDMGAAGLFVPRVDSVEQAEQVARAFSFPPRGTRGAGGTSRAGRWGLRPTDEYLASGPVLVVQLEAPSAIDEAERIAAVDGVGALFVGAADLTLAMGMDAAADDVAASIDRARQAAHRHEIPFGLAFGASADSVLEAFADGTDFALAGNDSGLLAAAATALLSNIRTPDGEI